MTAGPKFPSTGIAREIVDGNRVLRDDRCSYAFTRLRPNVVEVTLVGTDSGQFGTAIIDELALALFRERSLRLFFDASAGHIASVNLTTAWARFFEVNKAGLLQVNVLVGSKADTLALGVVRHLSRTGDLIRIHAEREAYEASKASLASTP